MSCSIGGMACYACVLCIWCMGWYTHITAAPYMLTRDLSGLRSAVPGLVCVPMLPVDDQWGRQILSSLMSAAGCANRTHSQYPIRVCSNVTCTVCRTCMSHAQCVIHACHMHSASSPFQGRLLASHVANAPSLPHISP